MEDRCAFNFLNVNSSHYEYTVKSVNEGEFKQHNPVVKNKENHAVSLAVYLSPSVFLGLDKKQKEANPAP